VGQELVVPRYGGQSLLNVPASIVAALGGSLDGLAPLLDPAVLPAAMLEGVEAVLLLVVDGLGAWQLDAGMAAGDAPTLADLRDQARSGAADVGFHAITSVFPSSTIPALTTLATGLPPSAHGLLGWTVYLEEFGEAAELARWGPATGRGSYQDERLGGHDPVRFLDVETLPRRLGRAGVESVVVCPAALRGSGLSAMTFQGAEFLGVHASSSVLVRAEQRLRQREAGRRLYLYAYWDLLDTVSHRDGPLGGEHGAELAALDLALGRWLERHRRRGDLLVLLTADHGHVPTDPLRAVRLDRQPGLLEDLLAPPTGERRLIYLHARSGRREWVRAYCADRLAGVADWIDAGDVIERGWLGPGRLSPAARRRLGDGVLVACGDHQLVYPIGPPSPGREPPLFAGNHGALDAREMLVPLLALRV
jgi:hypothetical protein